ncbi:MAG TPA: acetyl-CoA carboxylase biotin carboxylase subunit [Eubacteriaceae bacterium]|nr:acetyl-CoA carboxylase biotin carboxylase subunit [Eubacteriaceae bacterium]
MPKFHRILIANRGEIAVRIIRACKTLGIETVAIYSTADKDSLHTVLADYAMCIGGGSPKESYLNLERIMTTAVTLGVDAIHPGYGFLSENSRFAQMCTECNIVFIGPSAHAIEHMGNKSKARQLMIEHKVPVIPGSNGAVHSLEEAEDIVESIGYPVMIKASSGGGGKGMRIVEDHSSLETFILQAQKEAENAFGDPTIYIEKYIRTSRHIEFQILADTLGNTVHLFDRECSIQRNNQKMIEESPSAALDETLRNQMGESAVKAAKAIDYYSAGTVEFLLDEKNNYYFIEMNTRIQVEHPVTEMVTGIDLIKKQIEIAEGLPLNLKQEDITITGHAIECRINAEDPDNGFVPSAGLISDLHFPGGNGVRIDSHVYPDYRVPVYYDSMLAKIICHDHTRHQAIDKMKVALDELVIGNIKTNRSLQQGILAHEGFRQGTFDTGFLNTWIG